MITVGCCGGFAPALNNPSMNITEVDRLIGEDSQVTLYLRYDCAIEVIFPGKFNYFRLCFH